MDWAFSTDLENARVGDFVPFFPVSISNVDKIRKAPTYIFIP